MIDPLTVSKIYDSIDIVDVVSDFVQLKRKGANYLGLCPFHNEKTPSFTVSSAKGIFKCFGCGKGGNSVNFIMECEHLSYVDALKYLAKKYGIEIEERELTEEEKKINSEKESLYIVSEYASTFFSEQLTKTVEGRNIGLIYFKERGFNEQIIKDFKLGYSPVKRDIFTQTALKKGYKIEFLEKTGLTIVKENNYFDRFASRVIFPIIGLSGRVIGFGGRTLKTDKKVAKYLNSPESNIYNKRNELYGLYQAKNEIIKKELCYLVEGYTDVLSLYMSGIKNVVASSGTSLTVNQIKKIQRFTNNITILYDGDPAGIKASLRGIDMILEHGLNVRILLFPEGEDPDSFARKNAASEIEKYINENQKDFIRFKASILNEEAQNDPIKRTALIQDIVRTIAVIDDKIKQAVYIRECSSIMNIQEAVLYTEVAKINRKKFDDNIKKKNQLKNRTPQTQSNEIVAKSKDKIHFHKQEHEIIRILLLYGNKNVKFLNYETKEPFEVRVADYVINELKNDDIEMRNLTNQKIFKLVEEIINNNEEIKIEFFTQHHDYEISELVASLCSTKYQLSSIWKSRGAHVVDEEKKLNEILEDILIKYKLNILKDAKKELNNKLKISKTEYTDEQRNQILLQISRINKIIRKLSELQGRVIM